MRSGDSALHAAAKNGDLLSAEALVKAGADVNIVNGYDGTRRDIAFVLKLLCDCDVVWCGELLCCVGY
jgi:ankyrin repeat protein